MTVPSTKLLSMVIKSSMRRCLLHTCFTDGKKFLWRFIPNPLYKLDITKDYADLPILRKKDVYIMKSFVNNSCKNADLKALNFALKFIQTVILADIATIDRNCISQRSYKAMNRAIV